VKPVFAQSFSVVVPLYNKERSVSRCLRSILSQSLPPGEIIIVNDGSTDKSLTVVQQLTDPRIRIYDQPNGGVSSARNFGIAQAQNELVALLDADDEWHPTFLENMASLATKFPGAGLYYAAHNNVHAGKIRATTVPSLPPGAESLVNIFHFNTDQGPWSSAVVLRKSFLARTGQFDPKLVKGEDIDLWIRFALNAPIALHNAPLSTCHGDSENRAMEKPSPPERSLVSNLNRYESAAKNNLEFYLYLQQMRVAHICNFLGGNRCELANAHDEIDHLDLRVLPAVWTWIQKSPRGLRRVVFKAHIYAALIGRKLFGGGI